MVPPAGRLDLELCAKSGQVFRWQVLASGKWLGVDGEDWYVVDPSAGDLQVTSNAFREDFASFFRLDWDAEEVEREILRRGPELEPYMEPLRGLRLLRPKSAVESVYSFLCTANNNLSRIVPMVRTLASYGPLLTEVEGVPVHAFPGTSVIASLDEGELRSKGFGYRGGTIPDVARQILERGGDDYIWRLRDIPYEDAHRELISLKGIGRKLADCIALFGLHHADVIPIDTHIWQGLTRLYFPEWKDKAVTDSRYLVAREFFRGRFGELTGWAHQYLFYDNVLNWRSRRSGASVIEQ